MRDYTTCALKNAFPMGANYWLWLTSHDINWYVAAATIAYIGLQAFYLIKNKGMKGGGNVKL